MKPITGRNSVSRRTAVHRTLNLILALFTGLFLVSLSHAAVLLGDQQIETTHDGNAAGVAEAFRTTASTSGTLGSLSVYVDSASTATRVVIGLYSNNGSKPGTLLAQGTLTTPVAGAWNTVSIPNVTVTAGGTYWIAVLGPSGSGAPRFRDKTGGVRSETSSQKNLTGLPSSWSTGTVYADSPISAYGSSVVATQPVLSVSPSSLAFSATQGGANPLPASLNVTNSGTGTLTFSVAGDALWLSALPSSGTAPQAIQVSAAVAGLTAGSYTGHVTVTAPGSQNSPAVIPVTLTVLQPPSAPTVTGISPVNGPTAGGTAVVITGTGFIAGSTVNIGAVAATGVVVNSTTSISAVTPAGSAGAADVVVTNNNGTGTLTGGFTYVVSPPVTGGDWLTAEHDPGRSGYASGESVITTSSVKNLVMKWSAALDGKITAQPLFASGVQVNGQTHDVVVTATASNSIYVLDAGNGNTLWTRNFGATGGNCAIPGGFGITAAPVIDKTSGRIYTVSDDGNLRTLSIASGTDAAAALAVIGAPATNKVWGGLNLFGNSLYIASASDGCDTQPWRGRVYRIDISGASPAIAGTFDVVPGITPPFGGGGIWGYGGVSIDSATGRVYEASGADSNGLYQPYADRVVALDANLNLLGSYEPFHPVNFPCSGAPCDVDFGATPIIFQPPSCPTLAAAGNKNGILYLFNTADLAASGQLLQALTLNTANDWLGSGGVGGVPAYWPGGNMLFVTDAGSGANGAAGGIVGLSVSANCTLQVAWSAPLGGNTQPNSTPTVAGGVVFVGEGNGGRVHAFDAGAGTPLWDSGFLISGATYAAPVVAQGVLYVASWNGFGTADGGTVRAFGIGTPNTTVLLGDQAVEGQIDSNSMGKAEAFQAAAAAGGTVLSLTVYLDATSTATSLVAGIYSDVGGHPGALLAQGSGTSLSAGAWNKISLPTPGATVSAGMPYWIAILGTQSGTPRFRDRSGGCLSETSSQAALTALPASWTTGVVYNDCPLSAYGSATP